MRSLEWALFQYDGRSYKKRKFRDRYTQGECHVSMNTDIEVINLQAKERVPANHQKSSRGKEGLPYRFQREHDPTNTLISDF